MERNTFVRDLESIDREIKNLLGISPEETVCGLIKYKEKYFQVETYDPFTKKPKKYHVKKKALPILLELWKEREKAKLQEEKLKEDVRNLLREYKNPELIRKILEDLLKSDVKTSSYAYYKEQALKLFEEFKENLLQVRPKRLTYLQVLYLLANAEHTSQALKAIKNRDRDKKIKNPFAVLKEDLFIGANGKYDFLLSPYLAEELEPLFKKVLEVEKKKRLALSLIERLSNSKAKPLILKVFPSLTDFVNALLERYKPDDLNGEEIKSWLEFLESAEEKEALDLLQRISTTCGRNEKVCQAS